jgi:glutamate racemase
MSGPSPADPVGVFDSGVGGLTLLADIRALLPGENLLYVADSGHAPYGDKPQHVIIERSLAVTGFLLDQGAKAVAVACNTATSAAVRALRARFTAPIVAMEPAIKPAVASSRTRVIGVLATTQTVAGDNIARLTERFGSGSNILLQSCPGLVERVEACDLQGPHTRALVERYVRPLVERGADTLVLGCTHYPFLTPLIEEIAGPQVTVINPGPAVARELRRRLDIANLLNTDGTGSVRYWSSGDPAKVAAAISKLQGEPVDVDPMTT